MQKSPISLEEGSHSHKYTTPEEFYRIQYFEAIDLLVVELEDRFEQKEYINPILALEELHLRAANGKEFSNQIKEVNESVLIKHLSPKS